MGRYFLLNEGISLESLPKNQFGMIDVRHINNYVREIIPQREQMDLPWFRDRKKKWFDGICCEQGEIYGINDQYNFEVLIYCVNPEIGYGLITLKEIKKDARVIVYGGRMEQYLPDSPNYDETDILLPETRRITAREYANAASLINYAPNLKVLGEFYICEQPNLEAPIGTANLTLKLNDKGQLALYATRDICTGEVLLWNYSFDLNGSETILQLIKNGCFPKLFYKDGRLIEDHHYSSKYIFFTIYFSRSGLDAPINVNVETAYNNFFFGVEKRYLEHWKRYKNFNFNVSIGDGQILIQVENKIYLRNSASSLLNGLVFDTEKFRELIKEPKIIYEFPYLDIRPSFTCQPPPGSYFDEAGRTVVPLQRYT